MPSSPSRRVFLGGGVASAACLLAGCGAEVVGVSLDAGPLDVTYLDADNGIPGWPAGASDFRARLYAPTQVVRLGTRWFIVDCWHHRIIHSEDLYLPIARWQTLDENIAGPHSIATDGHFFVAEDTGRHGVKVYRQPAAGVFEQDQYLPNIGRRPHRVLFDAARRQFLIVGSEDQTLYILREQAGALVLAAAVHVPELQGQYCRSITLQGDTLWFVGNFHLVRYRMTPRGVAPDTGHITLHARFHGSNDLYFFENGAGGILTSTPRSAVHFRVLDDLALGNATDLAQGTSSGGFSGTPYYVTRMPSGMLLIPEHSDSSSAIRLYPLATQGFNHSLAQTIVDFGQSVQASIERKRLLPT